jgi:hypothetical protein
MLVSGALLETFSPLQVVASFHGLAIVLCAALLLLLVGRRGPRDRGAEETVGRDTSTVPEGRG